MKYKNRKTVTDGIAFDSVKEATRYRDLKAKLDAGLISNLVLQHKFTLIPSQNYKGVKERPVVYIADFMYNDNKTGELIVEDVKGVKTAEYVIKRKLLLQTHGFPVREI